ncbi:hypothetical protein QFC21_000686 [Naganishia friedmannii]|uniref:Uncharacterized protein n=1 Tax=Naganishia friedmannii TaxID=89922 RepID=A0ACC2WD60_9TREE|nr:hypothetical protein QFC21_000686 [Naganishia friedmannii]
MTNPYARPRLIEFHEQPYTPPAIRRPVQDMLTFAWTHRVWPLQHTSPAVLAGQVLERVLRRIGGKQGEEDKVAVVDFCSGAGGPIPTIERVVNAHRSAKNLPATPFILTDIHPHPAAWSNLRHSAAALDYVPRSVDATRAERELVGIAGKADDASRHFRTFFLAFHHFDEKGAQAVIRDAMENADGIGYVVKYLASLAESELQSQGKMPTGGRSWVWEQGREAHTMGMGKMYYIVGRRADV